MMRRMLAATFVLVLAVPAMAEDKFDVKKLKGSWVREVEGAKMVFKFDGDKGFKAELTPPGATDPFNIDSDFTIDKDGVLKGEITKVESKNEGGPKKGDKYSFKIEVGKEKLIVSEFKNDGGDEAKKLVEGEYSKKAD